MDDSRGNVTQIGRFELPDSVVRFLDKRGLNLVCLIVRDKDGEKKYDIEVDRKKVLDDAKRINMGNKKCNNKKVLVTKEVVTLRPAGWKILAKDRNVRLGDVLAFEELSPDNENPNGAFLLTSYRFRYKELYQIW